MVKLMNPWVTMMLLRVKLVPLMLESGGGLEGREKVKVLPPPVRAKSSVSALTVKLAARRTASESTFVGRVITLNSFQDTDTGYEALAQYCPCGQVRQWKGAVFATHYWRRQNARSCCESACLLMCKHFQLLAAVVRQRAGSSDSNESIRLGWIYFFHDEIR